MYYSLEREFTVIKGGSSEKHGRILKLRLHWFVNSWFQVLLSYIARAHPQFYSQYLQLSNNNLSSKIVEV